MCQIGGLHEGRRKALGGQHHPNANEQHSTLSLSPVELKLFAVSGECAQKTKLASNYDQKI